MRGLFVLMVISTFISGYVIIDYPPVVLVFIPVFLYAVIKDSSGRRQRFQFNKRKLD